MPRSTAGGERSPAGVSDTESLADLFAQRHEAFDVLSDERRRRIYVHVKQSAAPVTVNEIAEGFEIHRNAAKFHLDKLLAAGLLRAEFRRVNGRRGPGAGRPSKLYTATDSEVSFTVPERHYDLLAHLLLRALTRGEDIEVVGEDFGRRLAASVAPDAGCTDSLECARAVLDRLGFDPEVEVDPDGCAWITTSNCPFGRVALEAPEGEVCRLDRAIIRGILSHFDSRAIDVVEHASLRRGHEVCVREICAR